MGTEHTADRFEKPTGQDDSPGDPITERHVAAFLIRRPIDPGRLEAIRDAIDVNRTTEGADWLLGGGVGTTASLFLDPAQPSIVWYIEVPRSRFTTVNRQWETLTSSFPLEHAALGDPDRRDGDELLVHAVHPSRPDTTIARATTGPDEPADTTVHPVDVELVELALKPGVPERLADWFARLTRRVTDGDLGLGRIETWSVAMLEAEDMFTESIFLERRPEGYRLVAFMEAADLGHVYEAFSDTWNPVARGSELILERVLERPQAILTRTPESGLELVAHATAPGRPRTAGEC